MKSLRFNVPSVFTKELKIQNTLDVRRLRISSNLLDSVGFSPGLRYERRILGPGAGFELRVGTAGAIKVHARAYKHRRNNPTETVIDERNQDFLNASIPSHSERVHLTMRNGVIVGRPVSPRTFYIRKALRDRANPIEAFMALSSGVDAACLSQVGFGMQALLEFRPQEKRDKRDLTETGIMTALANNAFRAVINEDIYSLDYNRLKETLSGQPPVALLHACLQCDDHSQVKGQSIKDRHTASLETTADMHYEALRLIETVSPAVVWIENVGPWLTGPAGGLTILKLRRWGYHVSAGVYDARDFGGTTSRKRAYVVASVFPGFIPPAPQIQNQAGHIWSLIADQLPFCRDVSGTNSLKTGLETGRARLITPQSASAPTVLKSQAHQAKDSVFIQMPDGRYLFPNETILRRLNGIPDSFSLDCVAGEVATEQIGQSIDWSMHHRFAQTVYDHISLQRGDQPSTALHVSSLSDTAATQARSPDGLQDLLSLS